MMRACLMCGQTFRYIAVDYQFWQMSKGKLSKSSKLDTCFVKSFKCRF